MNSSRLAVPVLPLASDFRRSLSIAREFGIGGIEVDGRYGIDLATLSDTGVRQIRKWLDDGKLGDMDPHEGQLLTGTDDLNQVAEVPLPVSEAPCVSYG